MTCSPGNLKDRFAIMDVYFFIVYFDVHIIFPRNRT